MIFYILINVFENLKYYNDDRIKDSYLYRRKNLIVLLKL